MSDASLPSNPLVQRLREIADDRGPHCIPYMIEVPVRDAAATIERLTREIDRLRAALLKYGRHLGDGTMGGQCEGEYGALGIGPCTCGLAEALRATHEARSDTDHG